MDTTRLIRDLLAEKGRVERAITALEALSSDSTGSQTMRTAGANKAGRRKMSPAARKRISEMMKKRWAARRKAAVKPAPKQTRGRRTMSAAARKKIAEAQKKRWAVQKKAAKKITATMTTVETPAEAVAATAE